MKVMFIGAAHEVTGSCHYLEACGKHLLIDCGMEQGADVYENQDLPVQASEIDYVLLTHAHIDHSGLLPLLYSHGFRGTVLTTPASCDLCDIMLKDSAHIQMFEAEWRNRKAKRAGEPPFVPLYEMKDAEGVLKLFQACPYEQPYFLTEGISVRFSDVGHLLGSASIELTVEENDVRKVIVFSGDIGNINQPLIKDPTYLEGADYVIMESTYGDRIHKESKDYTLELAKIIQETFDKGGNVVIPSFAVGRTQEILYFLRKIKQEGLLSRYPQFEVYVDSPLAIEATQIFHKNMAACFDEEAMELVTRGINPISFAGLKVTVTSEESRQVNTNQIPRVILYASGMCEAGRIRHHFKHNLWREECTILFVGYQAVGTLGRSILDGVKQVKLFGEIIDVKARIEKLDGISGHADREGLIRWLLAFSPKPERVFIVHGEDKVCDMFAQSLQEEYQFCTTAPYSGDCYNLLTNKKIKSGLIVKKQARKIQNSVFARLLAAGGRLMAVIKHNEGGANKDLAKFADQINALCDKWDR